MIRQCRQARQRMKVADSGGTTLSGGRLLTAALVLRRIFEREVLAADEKHVGVLLPPTAGGALVNATLALMRRVSVNLNYTLSNEGVNECIRRAGIEHVLTSRKVLEKFPFDLEAEPVFLEDVRTRATRADKLAAFAWANLMPLSLLERRLGLHKIKPDDLLTIIFTSGSTGEPKGVMLTHGNVGSNVAAIEEAVHIHERDVLMGVLPFFHSFGYTGTLWLALTTPASAVYHVNPLDAREIGAMCEKHRATILMAAPTFLRSYLKRCTPEQMSSIELVIVGAEKLPDELRESFAAKFGIEPSEGYGTTELSPVVSVNLPAHRLGPDAPPATKHGTVGKPLPGIRVKVVHPDTGEDVTGGEGLLLVTGPNVMKGYYGEPAKTAAVVRDGWYVTGDFARVDADGFIEITGRQSRFSKIGGEMVPHIRVEAVLQACIENYGTPVAADADGGLPDVPLAVTAVPDPKKGERLLVLHRRSPVGRPISVDEMIASLHAAGLPNLWVPDRDAFIEVESIPVLGSGKLDLKELNRLATELTQRAAAPRAH
jgi:acyl-[acyl-carrier-protein]-phospholipid O-acyltransferase/long-chain-fatty-acid--[acyl-carrier-protein] ligase